MQTYSYSLPTIYDSRQSFYNKAMVVVNENSKQLFSYNTFICSIENSKIIFNKDLNEYLLFSQTTLRHIKEFLKQNGYKAETKQQIINDYFNN